MQLISPRTGYSLLIALLVFIGTTFGNFGNASASDKPAAPTELVATTVSSSKISLKWTDNATTETGYVVQKSRKPDRDFSTITKLPANSAQYVAKYLRASTTYYFRVVAYRDDAKSRSEIVTAVTRAPSTSGGTTTSSSGTTTSSGGTTSGTPQVPSGYIPLEWYGMLGGNGVSNTAIIQRDVSKRHRVYKTGNIVGYSFWNRHGYGAGTGGRILVQIYKNRISDPGSLSVDVPDLTQPIGGSVLQNGGLQPPWDKTFPVITFSPPAPVVAGDIIHVVFRNKGTSDAERQANHIDLNDIWAPNSSIQIYQPRSDAYVLRSADDHGDHTQPATGWQDRQGHFPQYALIYEDGFVQGSTAGEGYYYDPTGSHVINQFHDCIVAGSKMSRQNFTPHETFTADRIALNYWRLTNGTDPLSLRIEDNNGVEIETVQFAAATSPGTAADGVVDDADIHSRENEWRDVPLSSPHTFQAGVNYRIVLSAPSRTLYMAFPFSDLSRQNGGAWASIDSRVDGRAEFSLDGGATWTGWRAWGKSNRSDADLQIRFRKVLPAVGLLSAAP